MAGGLTLGLDWEALGAESSAALDAAHAVLVTGNDPVAAARAAIGIGRAQARTRRVAIGDLVGEVEPLQRLVTGDDPHGIVDSFLYGVSLNKIARQVDDSGMLFVMPSGTEPIVTPDIMRNERWQRLAAGFREVGALLLLVASSEAEGVHELAMMLDGVVVVGDAASVLAVPRNSVLAHVDAPPRVTPAAPIAPVAPEVPAVPLERAPAVTRQPSPVMLPAQDVVEKRVLTLPAPARSIPKTALIGVGVVFAALAAWLMFARPGASKSGANGENAPTTSAVNVPDSAGPGESADPSSPSRGVDSTFAIRVANPGDSLRAAAYGVVIVATNDEAQALARWADLGLKLPAGTVTMVRIRGERGRFFQMQAGAFSRARQADSLLASLRSTGKLKSDAGRVVATPYALVLESKVSRRAAQNVADGYGQRQIAAYPLLQTDGSATIFVGAFESPEQAVPLMNELKAKGVTATLYYRTGRSL
ncbi:MAG: SPOR domain-containing protein [Gemmatimonadaceae bacterium]|nr:SPOR domain-containing protein [Gemmatimonadaceae bacterium]